MSNHPESYQGTLDLQAILNRDIEKCPGYKDIDQKTASPNKLITSNVRLVRQIAAKYEKYGRKCEVSFLDLFQEGCLGLIRAIGLWNNEHPSKALPGTYAYKAIKQKVVRAIEREKTQTKLTQFALSLDELVKIDSVESWDTTCKESWAPLREAIPNTDFCTERGEVKVVADPPPSPEQVVFEKQRREVITTALGSLSSQCREIIELRFGLKDGQERTQKQVGEIMGVTDQAICQMENRALRKLRHPSVAGRLIEFLED